MKRIGIFMAAAFLLCVPFVAAENTGTAFQDTVFPESVFQFPLTNAGRARFLTVCAELSKHPVIKGEFEQCKTIKKLNRTMVSSGTFIISAENGVVWDTRKPFPSTMTVGRDFIIQTTPGGTKTTLSARGNETFLRLAEVIRAVFTGDPQTLLSNFDVFFNETGKTWNLGLIAKEPSIKQFAGKICMSGDSTIRSMALFQQNEDTVAYILTRQTFFEVLHPDEQAFFTIK
jgi:hypothetical protein